MSLLPEVDTDFGKRHFCGQVRVEFSLGSDIQVFKVLVSGEETCRGQTPSKGNSLYSLFKGWPHAISWQPSFMSCT